MRVRWAIERALDRDPSGTVYLALLDGDGGNVVGPTAYPSEHEAVTTAEQSSDGVPLKWKAAPSEWQPDTYLVSQFYDDPGWTR